MLGVGGLGHLAVQYARKLGYETIAVARGTDKEPLARELGAHHYVDSTDGDPAAKLSELGGVDLIMATVTNAGAMAALFGGLRPNGKLLVIGADMEPLPIPAAGLIAGSKQIAGHASGTSIDSEDTLRFSALSDVRPMIETMPLERAAEAYDKMMSGDAPLPDGADDRLSARATARSEDGLLAVVAPDLLERLARSRPRRRAPGPRRSAAASGCARRRAACLISASARSTAVGVAVGADRLDAARSACARAPGRSAGSVVARRRPRCSG